MPILKQMLEKGILNFDGYLAFGGSEPGVLEEFDEIANLFLDNNVRSVVTNSSGIKYVESIGKRSFNWKAGCNCFHRFRVP